jgi:hypothetical protein
MAEFCYKCQSPVSLCICDESITDEYEYHAWCEKSIAELKAENAKLKEAAKAHLHTIDTLAALLEDK